MRPIQPSQRERYAMVDLGLEIIGRNVRRARLAASLTQAQLGALSGIDQTTISRLETGKLDGLRLRRLARIAAVLNGFQLTDTRTKAILEERLSAHRAHLDERARSRNR